MEYLDKVDVVRQRTGVGYERVVEALQLAKEDVVEAIIILEREEKLKNSKEEFEVMGKEVINKIKKLIREGNIRRIKVKQKGRTIVDIPVTAGVIGTMLSPVLATLGAATALLTKCKIEVERPNDKVQDIDIEDDF
ncbi:DUF4342 domain-containing protein [Halonatronum saccharophilum]|uniref:DUF4342 domain-containing protein n=1 Tax=Halonatronum saccharophilum TaxID=150060 RepID=UPI0004881FA0|nr:DUF4342 domain-containing protein [Halonatronum saccharophilum]